jgi:hypothetical protein
LAGHDEVLASGSQGTNGTSHTFPKGTSCKVFFGPIGRKTQAEP